MNPGSSGGIFQFMGLAAAAAAVLAVQQQQQ
jgi:hypothetical protein